MIELEDGITCIIPTNRPQIAPDVIGNVNPQVDYIIIADNDTRKYPGKFNGKVNAVLNALDQVQTDKVLCLDDDTTLTPNFVEHLQKHLADEVVLVTCGLTASKKETWVEKSREEMYKLANKRPRGINGQAFLTYTSFLKEYLPTLQTLVEDEELGRIITKKTDKQWVYCKLAIASTIEPNGYKALLRQLTRWNYGGIQKSGVSNRYADSILPFIFMSAFTFLIWPIYTSTHSLIAIPIALSIAILYPAFLGVPHSRHEITSGVRYGIVSSIALWIAVFRFITGRPPKWR